MPNLNKWMGMGNLTRDPEIKYTPKGTAVADISLAINRVWKNDAGQKQEETTYVEVELWGRQAEIAGEYLKKGRPVYIEGRLKLDTWDDKQTGQKRSKMRVVGETLQLLGSRDGTNGGTSSGTSERTQSRPPRPARPPVDPDLDATDGDDVPF